MFKRECSDLACAIYSPVLLIHFSETLKTVHQAQCLANQVQLFYASQRYETFRLVETFNHKPEDFKHMSVIAELEQSGIGPTVTTN